MTDTLNYITSDLLDRYDIKGPRYTSYPTAVEFSNRFKTEDAQNSLIKADSKTDTPFSVYLHIPFCSRRCHFCGCTTFTGKTRRDSDRYVHTVFKEIDLIKKSLKTRSSAAQIHLGGGTPTFLTDTQLENLTVKLKDSFKTDEDTEISIEVNPAVTTLHKIDKLYGLGFNRISFGVQDLNSDVLDKIGRPQKKESVISFVTHARQTGFRSVNLDLIYGLPGQTVAGFDKTLDEILTISPDRVALYSFAYLPELLSNQKNINAFDLPVRDEKFAIFANSFKRFLKSGYVQIGMDHFAKKNDELAVAQKEGKLHRNFMGYTVSSHRDMLGIGASSISYMGDAFFQNSKDLNNYEELVNRGTLPVIKGYKLNFDDRVRQYVIGELMCNFKVDFLRVNMLFDINFSDYFKKELTALTLQQKDEYPFTEISNDRLLATLTGKIFIRNICMVFDSYRDNNSKNNFSRTV